MLGQVGRRGHASTLRVNPGVDVVGDVTARNPADRTHGETKLFTALQHLRGGEERRVNSPRFIRTVHPQGEKHGYKRRAQIIKDYSQATSAGSPVSLHHQL